MKMMNNLFQETLNKLKSELDYQPLLEEACKRVVLKYNPYPSQCKLDYFYDNQHRVEKINVKLGDVIHAVVVCGKFIDCVGGIDPFKIQYTKAYVIYLGELK